MKNKKVPLKALQFNMDEVGFDKESDSSRKFTGLAYSGKPIMNHPFWGNLVFDCETVSSEPKIPVLFNHDPGRIVGHGTLRMDKAIFIDGQLSKATDEGTMVENLLDEGFPMKESVYIQPSRIEEVQKGVKFSVNGQDLEGPFVIFRDSVVKEVSMTPLPADINTSTHIFNERLEKELTIEEYSMSDEKKQEEVVEKDDKQIHIDEAIKASEDEEKKDEEAKAEDEEVKEEEVEGEKSEDEKKFSEMIKSGDVEGAFKFACSCNSKKTKTGDSDFEALKKKYDSVVSELAELKKSLKKKKKFSIIEEFSEREGLKFSAEAKEAFSHLGETELNKVLNGMKVEKKRKIDPRLLKETSKEDNQFSIDFDENDAKSIQEAAKKFVELKSKEGIKLETHEAIAQITKLKR